MHLLRQYMHSFGVFGVAQVNPVDGQDSVADVQPLGAMSWLSGVNLGDKDRHAVLFTTLA